jgi:hypothetical protein
MEYNALDLKRKFNNINVNKNKYITLEEAINFALKKSKSGLGPTNRNRFQKANIKYPYGKLDINEYQRMAKIKRGIQTVGNLRKMFNGGVNRETTAANRMKQLHNANSLIANLQANVGGGRKPLPLTRSGRAEEQKRKNNAANRMKQLHNANSLIANLQANVGGGRKPLPLTRSGRAEEQKRRNSNDIKRIKGAGGYCTGLKKCVKSRAECYDNSTLIKNGRCNNELLSMQINEINEHASNIRNLKKESEKVNLATHINTRTDPVSQIKNKLLQLNKNRIKIRQSVMSIANRDEILKGTITAQRAKLLLKKLDKL